MDNKQTKNTRIELIAYIKANSPKIIGINRMKKEDLLEIYSSLTKTENEVEAKIEAKIEKEVEAKIEANIEAKIKEHIEEEVEAKVEAKIKEQPFDFSKLSKEDLKYDINAFLENKGKRLSGINSKNKDMLLKVIKHLVITKHYTKEEKDEINQKKIEECREKDKLERTKNKIEKFLKASHNIEAKQEYLMGGNIETFEGIIEKYEINTYDYSEYEKQLDEKFKSQFEKSLLESGILPSSVIETEDDFLYNINGLNVHLAKRSYFKQCQGPFIV